MAKEPESESPCVKHSDQLKSTSLATKLGLGRLSWPSRDHAEASEQADEEVRSENEAEDEKSDFSGLLKTIKHNIQQPEPSLASETPPSTASLQHPSALASRRHLQRPPRNVNITSHLSPFALQASDNIPDETFPGPQPLPPSTGVARTPLTADLRAKIESRIYEPDLIEIIEAYAEERVKRDRKHYTPRRRTPATSLVYGLQQSEHESPIAALRVRMLLLPAMILLSKPRTFRAEEVENAMRYARSAQELAQKERVDEAFEARCAYYIGLAAFLLLPRHALQNSRRPASMGSLGELGKAEGVLAFFEQACAAKKVYDEGAWAQEWVEYLSSAEVRRELSMSLEEERPGSSGSWGVGAWLKRACGFKEETPSSGENNLKKPPKSRHLQRRDSGFSQTTNSTSRPEGLERIPSFESWRSGESRPCSAASTDITEFSRADAAEQETSPPLSQPVSTPKTSPRSQISFAGVRLSPILTSASSDGEIPTSIPSQSKKQHRRRTSLLAMVTGRERRPSELEQAEEGDSPFRATFESVPEVVGEGMRKRRVSGEAGEIV